MATKRESVFLLTRSLDVGGTQRQVAVLAKGLHERGYPIRIGLFYGGGVIAAELQSSGIEIVDLGKRGRWDLLPFFARLVRELRRSPPAVIYSFLGDANIVAALLKPLARRTRVVWSIRNSEFDMSIGHWLSDVGYRVESALSRYPDAIVANSMAGLDFAISRGFPADRIEVVPNGIDTQRFAPDPALRRDQRRALGLRDDEIAVGVLGRLNLTKGYPTFLRAGALVAKADAKSRFLCVGEGPELERLQQLARELGIADRVIFTGELDAPAALNAFDIACSPSVTEGFSNAIAEAMSCGLPCIVTDVGDSAAIVGEAGTVVPPSSPEALAEAIEVQIRNLPGHNPEIPRRRIVNDFSLNEMVERTLGVLWEHASG